VRGRDWFRVVKPLLLATSTLLRILPTSFAEVILELFRVMPTRVGIALRYSLIRRIAKCCGDNLAVFEGCYLHRLDNVQIGDNVSIHPMCYIDALGGLTIGSNVSIAHGTTIITFEHDFSQPSKCTKDTPVIREPVTIGNDVWISAGVRILAGVTIGDHVVIGAGSVVTKDIPSNSLAVGIPARPIRSIKEMSKQTPSNS
jgi:acetyltransferase-like isoleucine patch superfamily enzyme